MGNTDYWLTPNGHVYVWAVDQPYRHYQDIVLQHPDDASQPISLYGLTAGKPRVRFSRYACKRQPVL